jgi:hypothetical protein
VSVNVVFVAPEISFVTSSEILCHWKQAAELLLKTAVKVTWSPTTSKAVAGMESCISAGAGGAGEVAE